MDQKLGKQEDGSELVKVSDDLVCRKDNHYFVYKSSREVKCKKCPLGYPIGIENTLKDGHIYYKEQFVI